MSDVKIATRDSYGKALLALCQEHENVVVLDADLAESTKSGVVRKAMPERFYDCGIAEGNMIAVSAGMSTTGLVPFASGFAMFATGRAFEQIRNAIGYPHLNVKICASHAGVSVGEDGATHQCLEDIALMRTIPGMTVICPCDDNETRLAVKAMLDYKGPVYFRTGRPAVDSVTGDIPVAEAVTVRKMPTFDDGSPKISKVEIVCKEARLEALKNAMMAIGITGMTVTHVLGCGTQKGKPEYYRGVQIEANLLPKVQVNIVVCTVPVGKVIETAKKTLYTGHIGDGKIFVYDVEEVVKVRTGQTGLEAMQNFDSI